MNLGIARLARHSSSITQLMIPSATTSAAPPRLSGVFGVPNLYEAELFRGREHPPDIREMLGARN
jgi:hypothetical protein